MYSNDNVAYAHGRLVGTIVRHQNRAVSVVDVRFISHDRPLQVMASVILTGQLAVDDIDNFDLTPVKLGWVNNLNDLTSAYLTRAPVRQDWRQGFRPHTAREFLLNRPFNGRKVADFDLMAVANTIEGKYPSFAEITHKFKKNKLKGQSLAWCRDFSLTSLGEVVYKMYGKVGNFIDGTILLDEKFVWVEESLKEVY